MQQKKITYFIILLFILVIQLHSNAQTNSLGSWNILNVRYAFSEQWSLFGEAQIRSLKFYQNFHYYEYKGGVQYALSPNLILTLAAGDYDTYREGGNFVVPKNNDEFRLWYQIALPQTLKNIKIEQRYRLESRFTTSGYRNRFRYRMALNYPFGNKTKGYKPYQVGISNELFFTDKEPYFERNRLQFSFNYQVSSILSFQIGYLYQFDYKINDEIGRDFLQIGTFFNFKKDAKK